MNANYAVTGSRWWYTKYSTGLPTIVYDVHPVGQRDLDHEQDLTISNVAASTTVEVKCDLSTQATASAKETSLTLNLDDSKEEFGALSAKVTIKD